MRQDIDKELRLYEACTVEVLDYLEHYHPKTRGQIVRYIKNRREFPYDIVRRVVDVLYQHDKLPGVLI